MSIGLLLITHRTLAEDLLIIASDILGNRPEGIDTLEVFNNSSRENLLAEGQRKIQKLDQGDGVLILTDLYGATPANIAIALAQQSIKLRVLAGVNLPMLLRALNYAHLDLDTVTAKACEGGRDCVRICSCQLIADLARRDENILA